MITLYVGWNVKTGVRKVGYGNGYKEWRVRNMDVAH